MESAAGGSGNTSLRTLMFNDKIDTPNLGDFLRVKENNTNHTTNNLAGLTLGALLSNNNNNNSNRTLLDIIRDNPTSSNRKTKKTWKHFRNRLRHKPDVSMQQHNSNPIMSPRLSPQEEELQVENAREEIGVVELEDQPGRMSLMALLTENDGDGSAYMIGNGDEEDEDDEDDDDDDGVVDVGVGVGVGGEYNNCCVCMVRHKGAAFIPCGHTFCRLCSRELWVQRGNCPLCNNFILEVLDIF